MTIQDRVNRLQAATAHGSALEQAMLTEPVLSIATNSTAHPGQSQTYVVTYESRRQAIFKPWSGQSVPSCQVYGQTRVEAPLHEIVAWRLAYAMGGLWAQLVPTAVLWATAEHGGGALINYRHGAPGPSVFFDAPTQVTMRRGSGTL